MRSVKTIDGWVDADYRPAKRPAHRPRNNAVLAARRLELAEFIVFDHAGHGVLESSLKAATMKFHCSRSHALSVLANYRRDLPVAISIYAGPPGSRAIYLVQGSNGQWRDVPNARISCLPTYEDSAFVASEADNVTSMSTQAIPGDANGGVGEALSAAGRGDRTRHRP